ncbi:MAG: MFS transporter [Burkholderiaceae bacterium]
MSSTSPTSATSAGTQHEVNHRALAAILLAVALATLDTAIANTALPAIAADLNASPAASIWVINAYQLTVVASLLPFAALGDLFGPRRIYLGGLAFFTLASLGCALAHSLPQLAAARALQGLGAGALMSVNIALIRAIYPIERLGRGVGFNALVVGVAFAVGPTVASLVLAVAPWPWLFAINVPLGLVALAFAWPTLPQAERRGHGFDPIAALLTCLSFSALIFALGAAAQREDGRLVGAALAAALVLGALLVRRERGHPAPMLPLDLLRRPMFALSAITALAAFATQSLAFVSLPFLFEQALHRDPVQTGFLMSPWPIVVALAAPIAGRLSDRYPPGLLGGIGLALLCLGMASMAWLPAEPSATEIALRMMVCGAGFGFFQSPNLKALMSSAPAARSGGASGVIGMVRLIGQSSGAALVALCFGLGGGAQGAAWALALGAGFAALAATASFARLWAR